MIVQKDKRYQTWIEDHHNFNIFIMVFSLIVTFRFSRIQFSRLGDSDLFQARLTKN
jgi:hypothetical protein